MKVTRDMMSDVMYSCKEVSFINIYYSFSWASLLFIVADAKGIPLLYILKNLIDKASSNVTNFSRLLLLHT